MEICLGLGLGEGLRDQRYEVVEGMRHPQSVPVLQLRDKLSAQGLRGAGLQVQGSQVRICQHAPQGGGGYRATLLAAAL